MRKLTLTVAMAALVVLPVLAQFRPGGFGGQQVGDTLLTNKSVQKELKFTEDQTKEVTAISSKQQESMKEAFPLFREDREKAMEIMKKATETAAASLKKVKEGLTSEQKKRFEQIQIQLAAKNKDVKVFKTESVVKALSLTDKQQAEIKETIEGVEKDAKELADDAKGDRRKMFEMFKKVGELNSEAFDKVVKTLSDDQKKAWTDAQGEKFELKVEFPGFGKDKGGFGKDKRKKKEDF